MRRRSEPAGVWQWKGFADAFSCANVLVLVNVDARHCKQRNCDTGVVSALEILLVALQQMLYRAGSVVPFEDEGLQMQES